ncbi:PKD domain-containing protein [Nocardioides litoris]|uniref:PKD domain-containing protein n=1 Tax=Nocardioides litoris TaxID=1926648 RepID=UPI0014771975|nr:PKD domain-containing protein [Nocardioides litoris]
MSAVAVLLLLPATASAHDGTGGTGGTGGHDHPLAVAAPVTGAAELPSGFRDEVVVAGLEQPTAAEQAADGRLLVLEKDGVVLEVDDLGAPGGPRTREVLDLRRETYNFYDRGALGLALDPGFTDNGWFYVLHAYNHRLGDDPAAVPAWGSTANPSDDTCPRSLEVGCEISSRLVRFTLGAGTDGTAGSPRVLVEDWCQQFHSHSAGAVEVDDEGRLYASGGEGASFDQPDWGQLGNACGDPVDEGGRLRSQDVRTPGDPTGLAGSVARVDPATGEGVPANPLAGSRDPGARRLLAHGFRNPFRFAIRPGTSEVYVGDVGETLADEIDRVPEGAGLPDLGLPNFGWPCFEGTQRTSMDRPLCTGLPASAVTRPLLTYDRDGDVVPGEQCKRGTTSISALAFVEAPDWPAPYRGALAFGDYARDCIWYLPAGADGVPDASAPALLVERAANPVDLFTGVDGDLFYVDIGFDEDGTPDPGRGKVHRISYDPSRPVARITSSTPWGALPLRVDLDASTSSDPDGGALSYAWDLDGDGSLDARGATASRTYATDGDVPVRLVVTDPDGETDTATLVVSAGNRPPVVTIDEPAAGTTWAVGDRIAFSGSATDPDDGPLPAADLRWSVSMAHCPGDCHAHLVETVAGAGGEVTAFDHELPSHLVLTATATDRRGLVSSVERVLQPRVVTTTVDTAPRGLVHTVDGERATTPTTQRRIARERVVLGTPVRQRRAGRLWAFASWSTATGAAGPTVTVQAPATGRASYVARFVPVVRSVRLRTSVPGLRLRVGSRWVRAGLGRARRHQVGTALRVAAPPVQRLDGRRYRFVRWSDGGARRHRYVVPDRASAPTAVYRRV